MTVSANFTVRSLFPYRKNPGLHVSWTWTVPRVGLNSLETRNSLWSLEVMNSNIKSFTEQPWMLTWTPTHAIFTNINTRKIVRIQTSCKNYLFPYKHRQHYLFSIIEKLRQSSKGTEASSIITNTPSQLQFKIPMCVSVCIRERVWPIRTYVTRSIKYIFTSRNH
jgi:hypothetical protein